MSFLSLLFPKLPFPDKYTFTYTQPIKNIRCVLQYKGTAYQGWQKQPHGPTIQGIIEKCISRITNESIKVKACGRTDAGVHALMQTINFFTHSRLTPNKLPQALNSLLPQDIAVIYADEVKTEFDAQFCVKRKTYIYLILNSKYSSPFLKDYTWQIREILDIPAMQEASQYLIGKHDFAAFMASGSSIKNTVRNIFYLEIKKSFPFIIIEIEADGFLRHMARNIVGTLIEIGLHKREKQEILSILASKDRKLAGINAPAKGLFLKAVKY